MKKSKKKTEQLSKMGFMELLRTPNVAAWYRIIVLRNRTALYLSLWISMEISVIGLSSIDNGIGSWDL